MAGLLNIPETQSEIKEPMREGGCRHIAYPLCSSNFRVKARRAYKASNDHKSIRCAFSTVFDRGARILNEKMVGIKLCNIDMSPCEGGAGKGQKPILRLFINR